MAGQNKAKIQVRDKDNVVLASSMLHRDVEARRAELRDPASVETARNDVMSLSRRLEEMDSKVDFVDAMLAGGSLTEVADMLGEPADAGAGELPSPDETPLDDLPSLELDDASSDLPLGEEDARAPSILDLDVSGDDLPADEDEGSDIGGADLLLDPLPGGDLADEEPLPPADELAQDDEPALSDALAPGGLLDGDLPLDDARDADPLPGEGDLDPASDTLTGDDLPADEDAAGGAELDLDGLLAQAAEDGGEPAGDEDLPLGDEVAADPFDDDGQPSIAGLELEDEAGGGPLEIGRLDISKLRARREGEGEEDAPARKPAPFKLSPDMLVAAPSDLPGGAERGAESEAEALHALPEDAPEEPLKLTRQMRMPAEGDAADDLDGEAEPAIAPPAADLPDQDGPAPDDAGELAVDDLLPADDPLPAEDLPAEEDRSELADLPPADDLPEGGETLFSPEADDAAGPASFRPLTDSEAKEHEEISARAVEINAGSAHDDEEFADDGLFAPDVAQDPFHDLDLGHDDDDDDEPDHVTPIDEDEPVISVTQTNVDSEQDRLAIFDMSADTQAGDENAGETRTAENGDNDMSFIGLKRAAKMAPDEGDADQPLGSAVGEDAGDELDLDAADAEDHAEAAPAKKKGINVGSLLRSAAVAAVLIGGGMFGAAQMGLFDLGGAHLAQLEPEGAAPAAQEAAYDPFAPIAESGSTVPALAGGLDGADTDPRSLAIADQAEGSADTLADQLARAAAGDLAGLGPIGLPAPDFGQDAPAFVEDAPLPAPAGTEYNPEDAFANIPDLVEADAADLPVEVAPEAVTADPARREPLLPAEPVAAPASPRPAPVAGSLDAAMSAFLSGYITQEELEARMGAYATAATTAEIESRMATHLERIEGLDAQMDRLTQLEARIADAIEQADRAEQLAFAQNDLVVEVVRMKGKVDMAESLIVDLSRRINAVEQLEPADRVATERALADLTTRFESIARDIGLIGRLVIKGEGAPAPSSAAAPTAAAGDVFARQGGTAPQPRPRLDPSKVPADVKKGDFLEGYGHVLDVLPTERGRMVVTENDSVIIQ